MTKTTPTWRLAKLPLAVSLATALSAPAAMAVNFNIGEIEGQFDSQLSVGASWSLRDGDRDLIGYRNGGKGLSQTTDDARQNFKKGETFSKIFKGIHDLELKYGDTGVFMRGKYWYDFELKDENREFKQIDDDGKRKAARASGHEILDAFVYHNYDLGGLPGSVRLGKQVVSWGESTFIFNGINAVNPVDVAAFRRPGAEIKEGLIPVNMFYVSQSLTDNLSAELFYQLSWKPTVIDNCGTFFSSADIAPYGCNDNLNVLANEAALDSALGALSAPTKAVMRANGVNFDPFGEGVNVARASNEHARDDGQWGLAFRYFAEELNTEFGAFFMNYHSRTPIFSANAAPASTYSYIAGGGYAAALAAAGVPGGFIPTIISQTGSSLVAANSSYFMEYPEDIKLYGLSFSTTLPFGTALSGELSYRPNAPLQMNTTDILFAGVRPLDPNVSILGGATSTIPGSTINGYKRKEITQFQMTAIHFFDQVLGASRLNLIGEVGVTNIGGLEDTSEVRYGRDPVFGPGPLPNNRCASLASSLSGGQASYCEDDGFVTDTSWGYRARAVFEYNDVFAGINLKPSVSWAHDVDGFGPTFNEGNKAVSIGLDADYLNTYTAGISYTDFFGGEFNTLQDRDFVSVNFGMSF